MVDPAGRSPLRVAVPEGTFDVLAALPSRFRVDASSLSAAEICPDNNLVGDAGLVLLDFEFALWRPIAWGRPYLSVPWPTCWCASSLDEATGDIHAVVGPHFRGIQFHAESILTENGYDLLHAAVRDLLV